MYNLELKYSKRRYSLKQIGVDNLQFRAYETISSDPDSIQL